MGSEETEWLRSGRSGAPPMRSSRRQRPGRHLHRRNGLVCYDGEVAIVRSPRRRTIPVPAHYHPAHVTHPPTPLAAGASAPDFALHATPDQTLSLADFRGRPVILAFYPADWSPVCSDQMALYNELLPEFHRFKAQLLGISVDGAWCHMAFAHDRNLHFPLLADFEPKGAVS